MNLDQVMIVARKEMKEIYINKGTWISALFFAFLFAITNLSPVMAATQLGKTVSIDWNVIYLSLFIGMFSGFTLCGAVFLREKQSGVVETLLCTPLSLRSIWLGKVVGVAIPSFMLALMSVGLFALLSVMVVPAVAAPSLIVLFHLVVVTPLFIAAAIGIVGYIQLAMGMRENRIVSMLVFIVLIAGLTVSTSVVQENQALMTMVVTSLLLLAISLLALSYLLSNRLNKEKIVTSIPD